MGFCTFMRDQLLHNFLIVNNKQIAGNDFLRLDNLGITLSKGDKLQAKTASGSDGNILISVREVFTGRS